MTTAKDTFEVVRSGSVPASPPVVTDLIADFHRWTEWSPWEGLDPDMQRTYSGATSGVGAVYEWAGKGKAGAGRMEITAIDPDATIHVDLQFIKPFKSTSETTFELKRSGEGTDVTWRMVGPKTFMSKVMGLVFNMDKTVGADFEKGLAQMAKAVEH